MLYRGMEFTVPEQWLHRHPGGRVAIDNHLGEDVTRLWDARHNGSRSARQQLFAFLAASWHPQTRAPPHLNGGGHFHASKIQRRLGHV